MAPPVVSATSNLRNNLKLLSASPTRQRTRRIHYEFYFQGKEVGERNQSKFLIRKKTKAKDFSIACKNYTCLKNRGTDTYQFSFYQITKSKSF
jgi:hypothetical protein